MSFFRIMFTMLALFYFAQAQALPLPDKMNIPEVLPETFTTQFNFKGFARLSNCSGGLVRFENSKPGDAALVLTNGHCIGNMPGPGVVIYREPSSRSIALLNAQGEELGRINATEILYATMTRTDMALYKMSLTYQQIQQQFGVEALLLSSKRADLQTPIEVISGYWRRGYRCQIEAYPHQVREDDWTWDESIRYSRPGCEVIGGTSGSPIVAAGTRLVLGVNNTINSDGEACTYNNPCEVDEKGRISYTRGVGYAQQTYWVYSCLNSQGDLDLNLAGCQLPKPRNLH